MQFLFNFVFTVLTNLQCHQNTTESNCTKSQNSHKLANKYSWNNQWLIQSLTLDSDGQHSNTWPSSPPAHWSEGNDHRQWTDDENRLGLLGKKNIDLPYPCPIKLPWIMDVCHGGTFSRGTVKRRELQSVTNLISALAAGATFPPCVHVPATISMPIESLSVGICADF